MTPVIAGITIAALLLSGTSQTPAESPDAGRRVESDSYTDPREITRCIAYNIDKKMPELRVRNHAGDSPDESGYLILTDGEPLPTTFGVIRVDRRETGSHLTTWLPHISLSAAPEDIARKLIAGC
ncbi:MAG: hypothetical protein M0P95_10060 [Sulfuritalea sp.]|jgi:hypothetical protein|nr:hypothetical protein [Sulfuritalea sp.]